MKVVFVGTVQFSLYMLITLVEEGAEIVGVVTSKNSGINSDYFDLVPTCKQNGIPYLTTDKINSQTAIQWIEQYSPDVIFCMGWSRLIKTELLQLPPMGIVGYHPAALPQNRGRHPLIWALVLGLHETASTFFFMDEEADSGDILDQCLITITDRDDASTLYEKMIKSAQNQLKRIFPLLKNKTYSRVEQDHSKANIFRKRGMADGEIDWRMSAKNIYNLVRGLTHPYVGAGFILEGQEYKVWKSRIVTDIMAENIEPGKIISISESMVVTVKCGNECIELLEIEPSLSVSEGDYL
jgi:methionyl-tRNA formyltransferase